MKDNKSYNKYKLNQCCLNWLAVSETHLKEERRKYINWFKISNKQLGKEKRLSNVSPL